MIQINDAIKNCLTEDNDILSHRLRSSSFERSKLANTMVLPKEQTITQEKTLPKFDVTKAKILLKNS